jgi:hypothetical protein
VSYLFGDPTEAPRTDPQGPPTRGGSVPGIEARHTWFKSVNGFGITTPLDALNHLWDVSGARRRPLPLGLSARPAEVAVGAVARLNRIGGLHSRADYDDNRGNHTARPGEYLLPSMARGRTVTYEGTLLAGSLGALRDAEALMRYAYAATEGMMLVEYNPIYATAEQLVWLYFGRPTALDITDEQTAGATAAHPHARDFTLAIRQHDPRYYRWNPADGAGFTSAGPFTVAGDYFIVTNDGTAPADPVFVLSAPGTNVTIHNDTAGWTMNLAGLPSLAGSTLNIDFGQRLAWKGAFEADLTGYINLATTDAWDAGKEGLAPGDNMIYAVSSAGDWTAKFRGSYW